MNTTSYKLIDIFTIENLKNFFCSYNNFISTTFSPCYIRHIKETITKFLECRDLEKNYAIFRCPICGENAVRPHTCKSKLCPTCGKQYSKDISDNFANRMIDKPHRHILFTMPNYLWNFFISNVHMLSEISNRLFEIFQTYYNDNSIIKFAFSVFFHTFGRDMKFNPHLHIIITEGGFKNNFTWKKLEYFHWQRFDKPWKKIISDVLTKNFPSNKKVKEAIGNLWSEDSKAFFNVKGETLNNPTVTIKYLGRYLARPPIAEYRITSISNGNITFWYKDLKSKNKEFITLPVNKFIGRIILQIPPKFFKMVRHYGLYARRVNTNFKLFLSIFYSRKVKALVKKNWQERIYDFLGFNPLICPNCKIDMEIVSIIYNKKVYSFKT